jgi:hypothetical protein
MFNHFFEAGFRSLRRCANFYLYSYLIDYIVFMQPVVPAPSTAVRECVVVVNSPAPIRDAHAPGHFPRSKFKTERSISRTCAFDARRLKEKS